MINYSIIDNRRVEWASLDFHFVLLRIAYLTDREQIITHGFTDRSVSRGLPDEFEISSGNPLEKFVTEFCHRNLFELSNCLGRRLSYLAISCQHRIFFLG